MKYINKIICFALISFIYSCDNKILDVEQATFTINDDSNLGLNLQEVIKTNKDNFSLLSDNQYPDAHTYINKIKSNLLKTNKIEHSNTFDWNVYLLDDDEQKTAFTLPGGSIYVSTGLLKYLASEEQLAGILAHEMAYVDRRLAKQHLEKEFGIRMMLDVTLGNDSEQALAFVHFLSKTPYTRSTVQEADNFALPVLCASGYSTDGLMELLEREMAKASRIEWLDLHPTEYNRIARIKKTTDEMSCVGNPTNVTNYDSFLNQLP